VGKEENTVNTIVKIDEKISSYLTSKADFLDNDYVEVAGDIFSIAKGVF